MKEWKTSTEVWARLTILNTKKKILGQLGFLKWTLILERVGPCTGDKLVWTVLSQMAWGLRSIQITRSSRVPLMKGKSTDGEEDSPQEGSYTKDHFKWTQCTESVCFSGQMVESSLGDSTRERRMARARTCGPAVSAMLANSRTMSVMATVFCITLMARHSMAFGKKERSMVDATTLGPMEQNTSFHTLMARRQQQDVSNQTAYQLKKSKMNTPLSPKRLTKESTSWKKTPSKLSNLK